MQQGAASVSPARIERAETALESFKRIEDRILALPESKVGRVTTDIPVAASIALGALKNLVHLRPDFERLLSTPTATSALDALQDLALAAFYAHLQSLGATREGELLQLVERARPVRENLLKVAESLVGFGLLPEAPVAAIREGSGHIDTAKDLVALSALFNSNWEQVSSKVPFGQALLDEAAQLGPKMLSAIGAKEVGEVRKDPSFDWLALRARAFRLLVDEYEELRRAVSYIRWYEGDARAFVPSLHQRNSGPPGPKPSVPNEAELPLSEQSALGGNAPAASAVAAASSSGVKAGLKGSAPFASE